MQPLMGCWSLLLVRNAFGFVAALACDGAFSKWIRAMKAW